MKPAWVLGIDLGSNAAGFVVIDEQARLIWHFRWQSTDRGTPLPSRLRAFALFLSDHLWELANRPEPRHLFVAVEMPWLPRRIFRRAAMVLFQQLGIVRDEVWRAHESSSNIALHIVPIRPAQAKQALHGSGRATKAQMVQAAALQYGEDLTEDEADALGIALAALARLRLTQLSPK